MFKLLTIVFAFVLALMLLAPESYLILYLTVIDGGVNYSGNAWEQLGTRWAHALYAPIIVNQHMPFVLLGLFGNALMWAFFREEKTNSMS